MEKSPPLINLTVPLTALVDILVEKGIITQEGYEENVRSLLWGN